MSPINASTDSQLELRVVIHLQLHIFIQKKFEQFKLKTWIILVMISKYQYK